MALPVPITALPTGPVTGDSSATFNNRADTFWAAVQAMVVQLNLNGAIVPSANNPSFLASNLSNVTTASQSLPAASPVKMTLNSTSYNVGSMYNTTSQQFVPTLAGKYHFDANLTFAATTLSAVEVNIFRNGVSIARKIAAATGASVQVDLAFNINTAATGDFFEVFCAATGTGTITLSAAHFGGFYIGP